MDINDTVRYKQETRLSVNTLFLEKDPIFLEIIPDILLIYLVTQLTITSQLFTD